MRRGPVVIAALLALAGAAPAEATYPGANGKLVLALRTGGERHVYTMNPDGSELRRLTAVGQEWSPAWSADGTRIVFQRNEPDPPSLFLMDADGSGESRLPTTGASAIAPTLSPDGRTVAFVRTAEGSASRSELFAMNVDGTELRSLAPGEVRNPEFSPDGTRIAFEREGLAPPDENGFRSQTFQIAVVNADGSGERVLGPSAEEHAHNPSFSPDGARIAFATDSAIKVMTADGTDVVELPRTGGEVYGSAPVFSPDGTQIAFAGSGPRGRGVYFMGTDGSGVRIVPLDFEDAMPNIDWQPRPQPSAAGPSEARGRCADPSVGTRLGDQLLGTAAGDSIRGLGGDDVLRGGDGDDCLNGGRGDDLLRGGAGDDRLDGSRGNDRLSGGPGRDVLIGGHGNDRLDARDDVAEDVTCGAGRDVARLGPGDRAKRCERVLR
jgi:Tol biopolymer transport system component